MSRSRVVESYVPDLRNPIYRILFEEKTSEQRRNVAFDGILTGKSYIYFQSLSSNSVRSTTHIIESTRMTQQIRDQKDYLNDDGRVTRDSDIR